MPTLSKTYCIKLYAALPSLVRGLVVAKGGDPYDEKYGLLEARSDIEALVEQNTSAEQLGGSGSTTTYQVAEADLSGLLRAIQAYNNNDKLQHIIHIELY